MNASSHEEKIAVTAENWFARLRSLQDTANGARSGLCKFRRSSAIATMALSLFIATGCQLGKQHNDGGGGSSANLVSITITPPTPSVLVGATIQLSGFGTLSDGTQVPNNGLATWASSNTAVATIDANSGVATGVSAGTTTISASSQGVTGKTTLTVNALSALKITTTSLPGGTAGVAYAATQLNATGGLPPYSWTATSGLPNGLTLSPSGVLSGTPTASGSFTIAVQVNDSASTPNAANANLPLNIQTGSGLFACGTGSGQESSLSGHYAFLLNGFDDAGNAEVLAGSFTADGAGNITAGEEDSNNVTKGPSHIVISATGSSYIIGSDGRGCLVLNGASPVTFAVVLSRVNTGKGRIIEFDDATGTSGTRLSGILRLQDTTSFALAQVQANYAFGIHGWDAAKNPLAAAGSFSNSNGTLSNGFADIDDGGTITAKLTGISGTISSISTASGRGDLTYRPGGQTLNFSLYMVNASEFFLVGADAIANAPITSGEAIATSNSFSSASLTGPYMFAVSGFSVSNAGGDVTIGTLNFNGVNTEQGTLLEDKAGTSGTVAVNGTYSIDAASGRVTLTNVGNHSPVAYLTTPTDGIAAFVVGTDSSATSGVAEIQSGGPFSANSLTGNYVLGTMTPTDSTTSNFVGVISFTSGIASGTEDSSNFGAGGLMTLQAISQTYTINGDGTGNAGANTAAVTNGSTIFFVDETPGKDPEIVVIEQ
jgi:Bacterial Ig-like domain (group 2)